MTKKQLKPLMELLNNKPFIAFAYLFGSRAKGCANKRSDWDIAVFFSDVPKKIGRWPTFKLEAELSRAVEGEVQVTVLNHPLPPVLGFEIVKNGEVLLDRDENLRMEFENRILRHYYDWQYFLRRQMKEERHLPDT